MNENTENIFIKKKKFWLMFFKSMFDNKEIKKFLIENYVKEEEFQIMREKLLKEFEEILPEIPNYGYKQINVFSIDLAKTALSLLFYRNLKANGFNTRKIGQIIYEMAEIYYSNLNPIYRYILRRPYFSKRFQSRAKKFYEERKNSLDPEDYHCEFVIGDNQNFLFGVNYTTCAGLEFLKRNNASEIAPYLCLCDYPMCRGLNIGFNREQNLAIGGKMCSFRFYRDFPTEKGWPPEDLTEYKSFKFSD